MRKLFSELVSVALFVTANLLLTSCSCSEGPSVSDYNVVWDSPSENAAGSMPIGNGEVGANFWVEPSGDMVFYISRTDAWSETGELYKLGRVRVSTKPAITSADDFCQTLDLENGRVNLRGAGMDLNFFIDSDSPTIYLTGSSSSTIEASVKAEIWRTKEEYVESHDMLRSVNGYPDPEVFKIYPDHVLNETDALMVYHHNRSSFYDEVLDTEGIELPDRAAYDPFLDRCFGYRVVGEGMQKVSAQELCTATPSKKLDIRIATFGGIFHDEVGREDELRQLTASTAPATEAMQRTADFWHEFWNRSYIYVQTCDEDMTFRINSSYILQRWIQACGGRGNFPIKFNGTIFTVDPQLTNANENPSPDYRKWGGDFWWQNTRLNYHPMLKNGDYDMMKPLFEHYFHNLPMMKALAQSLAGVDGALSPETATVFGTYCYNDYTQIGESGNKFANNPYIRYHWDSSVEMISLMLDYYDYTQDAEFVSDRLVPYAREMLKFYKNFYRLDDKGKLFISPTQSIETYWYDVVNDMPTVAGLRDVVPRLLSLPENLSTPEDIALWKEMNEIMPELPLMTMNGKTQFAPAEQFNPQRTNVENPRLYPIFPFHLCNISTDNLQIGIDSYWDRESKDNFGWSQDGQEAARLGLTDEAVRLLDAHTQNSNPNFRFKAIWGPNYDWTPDQDHGSSLLMILQDMVLQTWNGKDYLLPAFPKNWGVKYKLHSHAGQVVEGEYNWKKTPEHHFVDGICTECGQPDPALMTVVDGWYEVGTPAQLQYISNLVNSGKQDIKVRLTADIDLSGISYFPPIGALHWPQGPELYFSGTFDGQGHIIYNLSIDKDDPGAETGLFGRLNGATVKNVGIVNATFKNPHALRAGILAGCAVGPTTISNCFTTGDIAMDECICSWNSRNGEGLIGLITSGSVISNSYTTYGTIGFEDPGTITIENCYWGKDVTNMAPTGELCYKLNGDQNVITWFQKLGEDAYPVLIPTHGKVLYKDGKYENDSNGMESPAGVREGKPKEAYNLSGQHIINHIDNPVLRKGIYIINGRKAVIK